MTDETQEPVKETGTSAQEAVAEEKDAEQKQDANVEFTPAPEFEAKVSEAHAKEEQQAAEGKEAQTAPAPTEN